MRFKKAPILEAVLEFRWSPSKSMEDLKALLESTAFEGFGEPKQRLQIDGKLDLDTNTLSHEQRQLGYEVAQRDGSEIVFLEGQKFVFVKRAPYDRWESFSDRAMKLLDATTSSLNITEFSRVGTRFVNRIDVPDRGEDGYNTDDYVTVRFDGPRVDKGVIDEFQMRVVKPSQKDGLRYALVIATTESPLPDHSAILLDIDVFTLQPVLASGGKLLKMLGEMRDEKNDIFRQCLTDKARDLFGGVEP